MADTGRFSNTGQTPSATAPRPTSIFERRERERLRARVERIDHLAEDYVEAAGRRHYYAQQVERVVANLAATAHRVLEIGCGLGDLLAALSAEQKIGIDISPAIIEQARLRHPELDLR